MLKTDNALNERCLSKRKYTVFGFKKSNSFAFFLESDRKNVLNLVVYFEQLNYELNQQVAVYSVSKKKKSNFLQWKSLYWKFINVPFPTT